MDEKDIWRSATRYIKLHGADATIQAAMMADKFLAEGNLDAAAFWRQVITRIEEMENTKPDRLH